MRIRPRGRTHQRIALQRETGPGEYYTLAIKTLTLAGTIVPMVDMEQRDSYRKIEAPTAPDCPLCGRKTHAVGVEAHPKLKSTTVVTYECVECGDATIILMAQV